MLVKIKRMTKAGDKNKEGYYLNNLENCIKEFISLYNISDYKDKIISFDDEYVKFNIFDKEEAKIILNNIDDYRVTFKCIGQLDTDELSDPAMFVESVTCIEIRRVK